MANRPTGRRPGRGLVRTVRLAAAIGVLLTLGGCVVYPAYYRPYYYRPYYYYPYY